MKKIIIAGICLLVTGFHMPALCGIKDSIHIELTKQVSVDILCQEYATLQTNSDLWLLIEHFQKTIKNVPKDNFKNNHIKITYSNGTSLKIEDKTPDNVFVISSDSSITKQPPNECLLYGQDLELYIHFDNLADISNPPFIEQLKQALAKLPSKNRFTNILDIKPAGNEYALKNTDYNGSLDMLSLSAGIGTNLIKDKWALDVTGTIGLGISQKGTIRHSFYVSDNLFYIFNNEGNRSLNNFVNLGYRINTKWRQNDEDWLGIEVGYLTNREGDFFGENTFRVALKGDINKNISISPQFYFGKDNNFPGIRISYGL